jgi:hypothetical protein
LLGEKEKVVLQKLIPLIKLSSINLKCVTEERNYGKSAEQRIERVCLANANYYWKAENANSMVAWVLDREHLRARKSLLRLYVLVGLNGESSL